MADLSNWMETFKDKMDDKSYQIIFETLAANQFTSSLQLKLLTSDRHDVFKGTNLTFRSKKLADVSIRFR